MSRVDFTGREDVEEEEGESPRTETVARERTKKAARIIQAGRIRIVLADGFFCRGEVYIGTPVLNPRAN